MGAAGWRWLLQLQSMAAPSSSAPALSQGLTGANLTPPPGLLQAAPTTSRPPSAPLSRPPPDYQSRRLDIRMRTPKGPGGEEKKAHVHMLNSTLTATERTLCCILENYQTPDGVRVPPALQPYMMGIDFIPFRKVRVVREGASWLSVCVCRVHPPRQDQSHLSRARLRGLPPFRLRPEAVMHAPEPPNASYLCIPVRCMMTRASWWRPPGGRSPRGLPAARRR